MGGACFSRRCAQVLPAEPAAAAAAILPVEPAAAPAQRQSATAPAGGGVEEAIPPGVGSAGAGPQPSAAKPSAQPSSARPKRTLIKAVKDGNLTLIDELLQSGCGLEDVGMWDNTPLLVACAHGHCEAALRLIAQRANIQARNEHGATPLHYACVEGTAEVAQALVAAAGHRGEAEALVNCGAASLYSRHLDTYAPRVPLGAVAESGFQELAGLLLTARACPEGRPGAEDGRSPLWLACRRAQAGVAGLLLQRGADASAKDAQGVSVLEAAAMGGSEELVVSLLAGGVRDVNDTAGSPLREAVKAGRRTAAEALLAHGAAVCPRACEGQATPLHAACERGDEHLIALLVRARADPAGRDAAGLSALDLLRRRGLSEQQSSALLQPADEGATAHTAQARKHCASADADATAGAAAAVVPPASQGGAA